MLLRGLLLIERDALRQLFPLGGESCKTFAYRPVAFQYTHMMIALSIMLTAKSIQLVWII